MVICKNTYLVVKTTIRFSLRTMLNTFYINNKESTPAIISTVVRVIFRNLTKLHWCAFWFIFIYWQLYEPKTPGANLSCTNSCNFPLLARIIFTITRLDQLRDYPLINVSTLCSGKHNLHGYAVCKTRCLRNTGTAVRHVTCTAVLVTIVALL
jgi:hypothetical protein